MKFYEKEAGVHDYKHFNLRMVTDMQPHFHSSMELVFVKSGSVFATINGESKRLCRGDACFANAFDVHSYSGGEDNSAYVFVFDKKYANIFFSESDGKSIPTFFKFDDFSLLYDLYNLEKENFTETGFFGIVNVLFARIAKETELISKKSNTPTDLICRILLYTEKNLDKKITLESLGKTFGYNPQYVSRVINKYLPDGFKDYINALRVEKINNELKTTNASVLDVAFKWGFESSNSFYRAYAKRFGKPPRRKVDF